MSKQESVDVVVVGAGLIGLSVAEEAARRGLSVLLVSSARAGSASPAAGGMLTPAAEAETSERLLVDLARESCPDKPVFLLCHSMGGLVALDWILCNGRQGLAGVVASSPFLGVALKVNPVKEALGRLTSRWIPKLALPTGITGALVTRDPEKAREYDADPLHNRKATARWFTEAMSAIDRVHGAANELDVPILVLYGGHDLVVSADATDRLVERLTTEDRAAERLDGLHHEIVNEPPDVRGPVIERMADWIAQRANG